MDQMNCRVLLAVLCVLKTCMVVAYHRSLPTTSLSENIFLGLESCYAGKAHRFQVALPCTMGLVRFFEFAQVPAQSDCRPTGRSKDIPLLTLRVNRKISIFSFQHRVSENHVARALGL